MLFNSFTYVFFLLIVVVLYWRFPLRWRVPLLLIASYVFYMSWSPPFGLIYGPVIFLDSWYFYALSQAMVRWPRHKKPILIFGITTELMLLGYFKYSNLVLTTLEKLLSGTVLPKFHLEVNVFLPLAISFTNFILISYLVDVYRGREKPDPSFTRFATYVAFFPHLIAGPIVRASELLHQFDSAPAWCNDRFARGIARFIQGLAMKVLVADFVGSYVNAIYGDASLVAFNTAWISTYCFAAQILCDFWGYTCMAQGSAMMLGYSLPENFNAPYFATSITEFWRRWHMSLSRWLRDYLYIPLGGNQKGRFRTYLNLFITMGLGGLWHGASWTFLVWGLYHGLLLSLHKLACYLGVNRWLPKLLAIGLTFHLVCIGWVFFRAQSFTSAIQFLTAMVNPLHRLPMERNELMLLLALALFFGVHALARWLEPKIQRPWVRQWGQGIAYALFFYLVLTLETEPQEFIYFQF